MDNLTLAGLSVLGGIVVGVVGTKLLSNPDRPVYVGPDCEEARKILNDRGIDTGVCGMIASKKGPVGILWAPKSQEGEADKIMDAYVNERPLPPAIIDSRGQFGTVPLRP